MENTRNRHYYIDLARGIVFILMVLDHLLYNISSLFDYYWYKYFPSDYYLNTLSSFVSAYRHSSLGYSLRLAFVACIFIFISGISAHFSKNNFKRGLKLLIIALALTLGSYIVSIIIDNPGFVIVFGILHCLSLCMLLTPLLKKTNKYILLVISVLIIGFGFYFSTVHVTTNIFMMFNLTAFGFTSADYYPLFPFLGFYILGYLFGDYYFNFKNNSKITEKYNDNIFTYFGRNTLIWYFLHQVILVVFLALFTYVSYLMLEI